MLLSVCLLLSVFSLSGGFESGVGGKEVKPHSRPYMASLRYRRQHKYGGMLIRDDYLLTSAHCLNKTLNLEVVLRAHNISQNEDSQQIIQVDKYIRHPKYESNAWTYDIMLLKGDSGSPLFCDSELKGMAAFTYDDCTSKEYPEVYMKISAFFPWIKKNIK